MVNLFTLTCVICSLGAAGEPSVSDYGSIQEAIDKNAGRMIFVPAGDHVITTAIRLTTENGGLYGPGRLVQNEPSQPILDIDHAVGVRVQDVTLTRSAGKEEATASGVLCRDSRDVVLDAVRVVSNWARESSIELRNCTNCTVRQCEIRDYKRIAVDDRTDSEHYGYAFICIDGTGICVRDSVGTMLQGNRVIETRLFPTREAKDQYRLGALTDGRQPSHQGTLAAEAFKNGCVSNWHQGSAVLVTGPEKSRHTIVSDNYIQNAAQGFDFHADYVVCSGNIVNHGMMGVKAMHGCRNLIVSNNTLTHIDLWGILLCSGAASHAASPVKDGQTASEPNVDAGSIIANNIISDYGRGCEYWNWGGKTADLGSSYAMAFFEGQLPENPPLRDIIVQGNVVYDAERDEADREDGTPSSPRYRYAVYVSQTTPGAKACPENLHFANNLFHPGKDGVSNVPLQP